MTWLLFALVVPRAFAALGFVVGHHVGHVTPPTVDPHAERLRLCVIEAEALRAAIELRLLEARALVAGLEGKA